MADPENFEEFCGPIAARRGEIKSPFYRLGKLNPFCAKLFQSQTASIGQDVIAPSTSFLDFVYLP